MENNFPTSLLGELMLFNVHFIYKGHFFFSITSGKCAVICETLSSCTINRLLIELKIFVLPFGLLPPCNYYVNLLLPERLHCATFSQTLAKLFEIAFHAAFLSIIHTACFIDEKREA